MKKLIIPVLAAAVIITSASCSKKDNPSAPQAQVMFMNCWLTNLPLNVTANNTAVPNGTNITFLKNTGYQNVNASVAEDIKSIYPSTSNTITDTTVTFTANTHYSFYVGGEITSPVQVMTTDDLSAPASGMAKVRFINLSPDPTTDNLYIGTSSQSALASNVAYGSVTQFVSITATTGQVLVQDPNHPAQLTILQNQVFNAGKIYTIILTGTSTGTGTGANTITIVNNN